MADFAAIGYMLQAVVELIGRSEMGYTLHTIEKTGASASYAA